MTPALLNELLWDFYSKNSRDSLPWRQSELDGRHDPYKILVSEIMLQQTQVLRVIQMYEKWLSRFPDFQTLADASLSAVLSQWLGLGYNRRAKFLHECAKFVILEGFPENQLDLMKLPGIGANTAGAVVAYAYNRPAVFVETNIRTVFLYHFFEDRTDVSDKELIPLISEALDRENPREWYWALMDYGSYLKQTKGNYSRSSKHHVTQSKFEGSKRQIRGKVIKLLAGNKAISFQKMSSHIPDDRLAVVIQDLQAEGFIELKQDHLSLRE